MDLIELGKKIGVEGFLHCNEISKLVELAAGRDVLEVGAFRGLSAWAMAFTAKSVTSIDTFRANSAGQQQMAELTTLDDYMAATARYKNTHVVVSSSQNADLGSENFDMIFLDAMHDYDNVRADIKRWYPHLRPGGVMAFHDYGHHDFPGVKQAVDERFGVLHNVEITLGWLTK